MLAAADTRGGNFLFFNHFICDVHLKRLLRWPELCVICSRAGYIRSCTLVLPSLKTSLGSSPTAQVGSLQVVLLGPLKQSIYLALQFYTAKSCTCKDEQPGASTLRLLTEFGKPRTQDCSP